ncbi:hypothetical protein F511_08859 [Dorcoceras hygrometricum]|uniref:Uncharacterized protein n=1 Tax=Dorcoceras hygrometricum TaxID=472368 RepID=A0A2Z7ATY8_9LAMI|nr:hypothetical protein F511_08859 [Dorcoceras hygrometricum]
MFFLYDVALSLASGSSIVLIAFSFLLNVMSLLILSDFTVPVPAGSLIGVPAGPPTSLALAADSYRSS